MTKSERKWLQIAPLGDGKLEMRENHDGTYEFRVVNEHGTFSTKDGTLRLGEVSLSPNLDNVSSNRLN